MNKLLTAVFKSALKRAQIAASADEVPVGAIIFRTPTENSEDPIIISRAENRKECNHDPCGHAEIRAILKACKKLKTWRLSGYSLAVTLEPCLMCAGAIVQSRLDGVYFGARDPKAGAICSLYQVFDDRRLNHRPRYSGGYLNEECSAVLKEFFRKKRREKKR